MWRRSAPLLSRVCAQAATTAGEASARFAPLAIDTTFASALGAAGPASRICGSWQSSGSGSGPGAAWGSFAGSRAYSGASGALPGDSDDSDFSASAASPLDTPLAGGLDPEAITSAAGAAELDALLQATEEAWYPTIGIQKLVETIHERGDLPWWASILATTILVRGATFPITILQMKNTARMSAARPEMEVLVAWFKEEQMRGNGQAAQKEYQERISGLWQKYNCNPLKSMVALLVQAPVFICFFGALRHMAAAHVPSMMDGGLFWFSDLTVADPTYMLPVLTSLSFLATVEIGAADGMQGQSADTLKKMKMFMRGLSVLMVPFSASLPAGVFVYWITSNFFSMGQTLFLRLPGMKARLGLPLNTPTGSGTSEATAATLGAATFAQKPVLQATTPQIQHFAQPPIKVQMQQQQQQSTASITQQVLAGTRVAKKTATKGTGRKRRK